jgi:hypothetical protein
MCGFLLQFGPCNIAFQPHCKENTCISAQIMRRHFSCRLPFRIFIEARVTYAISSAPRRHWPCSNGASYQLFLKMETSDDRNSASFLSCRELIESDGRPYPKYTQ